MSEAIEAYQAVARSARTHADPSCRVVDGSVFAVNKVVRQGDLYIRRLAERPAGELEVTNDHQMAPGSTQGSRHVLANSNGLEIFRVKGADPLTGPVFHAPNGFYMGHPSHGDIDCKVSHGNADIGDKDACWYQVTYPRDLNQEEVTRVAD